MVDVERIDLIRPAKTTNQIATRLFEYDNYRTFLRDWVEEERDVRPGFSLRWFADRVGFKSSGYFTLILAGKRNTSAAYIPGLLNAMRIVGRNAEFLAALIRFNQSASLDERTKNLAIIRRIRKTRGQAGVGADQARYWENWYNPVVRELAVHSDWNSDWTKLGSYVRPPISAEKARRCVDLLLELGLLEGSVDSGFRQSAPVMSGAETPPAALKDFKKEMLLRAMEAFENLPPSKRHVSSATIAMSLDSYREFCSRIDVLRAEMLDAATEQNPEIVIQANFQMFPTSRSFAARIERGTD